MASLFALRVMSLTWMAFVAGLTAVKKTLPWRRVATYGTAILLLSLGVLLLAAPQATPALTVPGTGQMNEGNEMESVSTSPSRGPVPGSRCAGGVQPVAGRDPRRIFVAAVVVGHAVWALAGRGGRRRGHEDAAQEVLGEGPAPPRDHRGPSQVRALAVKGLNPASAIPPPVPALRRSGPTHRGLRVDLRSA
jgi:hypothetical protein